MNLFRRLSVARENSERAALDGAAADWLIAHDRGLTPPERRDFDLWLAADRRHAEAWSEARRAWSRLDRLPEVREEEITGPPARRPSRRNPRWPGLAAAAAALMLGLILWTRLQQPAAPLARSGLVRVAPKRLTLPDGSQVELAAGSEVRERFSAGERRVELRRGEAHFIVAKNPARPFIVKAGSLDVRAVGTVFDVRLDAAAVEVLVTEGQVRLDSPLTASMGRLGRPESPVLAAGQRAIVALNSPATSSQITVITPDEIARSLAWQALRLQFQDMPLDQVAAEFNRYNRTRLIVADSAAEILVAGTFRADNADVFVHFLEDGFHIRADRRGDGTVVLRRVK